MEDRPRPLPWRSDMRAIAATRSLDMIVEDTLRALVDQARAAGHTWAEIGELLHVSRQAAFQRFGAGRRATAEEGVAVPVEGAVETAVPASRASSTRAVIPASSGLRRTHLAARSSRPTGRATIGRPSPNRRRSSATASADG